MIKNMNREKREKGMVFFALFAYFAVKKQAICAIHNNMIYFRKSIFKQED